MTIKKYTLLAGLVFIQGSILGHSPVYFVNDSKATVTLTAISRDSQPDIPSVQTIGPSAWFAAIATKSAAEIINAIKNNKINPIITVDRYASGPFGCNRMKKQEFQVAVSINGTSQQIGMFRVDSEACPFHNNMYVGVVSQQSRDENNRSKIADYNAGVEKAGTGGTWGGMSDGGKFILTDQETGDQLVYSYQLEIKNVEMSGDNPVLVRFSLGEHPTRLSKTIKLQ